MRVFGLHLWFVSPAIAFQQLTGSQDAELSSYLGNPNAFQLYDLAVRYVLMIGHVKVSYIPSLAMENDWLLEEGWGLFLVRILPVVQHRQH
jgi:hypothetical protein